MNRRNFIRGAVLSAAGLYVPATFGIIPSRRGMMLNAPKQPVAPVVSGGGGDFDPTTPGSVWGYWKSDTGLSYNGSNQVATWADQSVNGKNLTQGTDALKPIYSANQKNGYGALTFDGSNDYLTSGGYDATFSQPFSIVAVCKPVTWIENGQIISGQGGSGIWQYNATPTLMEYSGGGLAVQVSPTLNTWIILTTVFNGTSSLIQVNDNASVGGANSSHTSPMQDFIMGAKYDGTHPANVAFAEAIAFKKALSSGEISTLVSGFKTKFGI